MCSVEKSAKTVELAVQDALNELNCTHDEAEIEILDVGSKGFIGLGAKPARVKVLVKYDPEKEAISFIKDIGVSMGIIIDIKTNLMEKATSTGLLTKTNTQGLLPRKQLDIILSGENMGILIGKRGQTLDALQFLVSLAINKGVAPFINVSIDSENYRQRRRDILENLALNLAKKVKATKRPVTLEPMNTFERRVIHSALQDDKQISTYSEGSDPFRNIIISLRKNI